MPGMFVPMACMPAWRKREAIPAKMPAGDYTQDDPSRNCSYSYRIRARTIWDSRP